MKKNFLTVAAMSVVAFFAATEIAKAADVTFSGQIRTRWEVNEQSATAAVVANGGVSAVSAARPGFNNTPDDFVSTRVRLNADVNINDSTSAFIQLQSVRTWGQASGGLSTGTGNGGSGNASGTNSDADASVGVHQAYFTLKNFANLPIAMDAKIGRQQVVLDGHRLFGHTGWAQGAQTHDAVRLTHAHDNMSLVLAYILAQEDGRAQDPNDVNDSEVYLAHFNYKGILGGQFSAIYAYLDNGCSPVAASATNSCSNGNNETHTIGGRQAGQLFGIDYRGEIYYQFGEADGVANVAGLGATGVAAGAGTPSVDRSAYMFGVRVGKTFNNVMFKPGITVWYDYLSGTTDEDQRNGDWKSFNTLFDTGHKFYGLMDVFGAVGGGAAAGTRGLGLQDVAVKVKLNPMPGWTFKADVHAFLTAEGIGTNGATSGVVEAALTTPGGQNHKSYLGHEVDLTLVNKYNANTNISVGYSNFNANDNLRALRGNGTVVGSSSDANWAYVQFDVKF